MLHVEEIAILDVNAYSFIVLYGESLEGQRSKTIHIRTLGILLFSLLSLIDINSTEVSSYTRTCS